MKLFIALDLPREAKDYMYDLQKKLKSPAVKIKLVSKKHFHFTIKFIGDVDETKIPEIISRLSKIKERKIKVKFSKLGFFPDENNIRVVWIGLDPDDEVNRLAQEVDGELLELFSDEQKFSPHLTLGRIKQVKKKEEFVKSMKSVEVEPLEFEFSWLKLYKSVRKGSTHEYVCLEEF